MRSVDDPADDRTARARVRDEALALFATEGFDAVSVRRVAAAADVSPALVLHHFGSKDGLREAVDAHVVALFETLIGEMDDEHVLRTLQGRDGAGVESFAAAFPAGSPLLPYLRRMLLTDDAASRSLVRHWYALTLNALQDWSERGLIDLGPDPAVRAALLLCADFGVVLMHGALTELLAFDPLEGEGIQRWSADAYRLIALMLTAPSEPTRRSEEDRT